MTNEKTVLLWEPKTNVAH